jgi:macrodomain Ter protein organizer (MatP/YcbG family)
MKCEQEDNRMDQDAKVERLLEMLRRAAEQLPEEEAENAKRILSKKLLRKKLESELEIKDTDSLGDDLKADCGLISDAMGKTLDGQPGSIEHKQRLWEVFNVWLAVMEKEYGFSISRPLRPFLESEDGKLIQLLKGLHGTDGLGCEREPLCDTIGVKEKTLRTYLKRLNGDLEDEPWTLGGQRVSTDVKIRKDGRKRYTYTPDTLHPIVMQLNITQAAYLLKSLGIAYDSRCYGNELSADLAYGIWSQLSPYAKKRIREAYVSEDRVTRYVNRSAEEEKEAAAFGAFLNKMEWKAEHWVDEFFTESEMLNRYDDGVDLMLALKDARYGMEHVYTIQCKDKIFPKCRFYFFPDTSLLKLQS